LTTISNWDGIGPSTIDFKQVFNEKLTLSERFMILTELLPMASFRYGIFNLLHFSDFAEKEYKKLITNNIPTENVIPTHLQNVEIKNYIPAQINNLDPANTHNKITKDSFIELIREIDKQMPDTEVRRVFLENRFIGMGYSVELGYKQTSYFYNELKKARDGQESIYKGTLVNKEDTFALVDSYTCYFKMNHVHFNNLEILVNTPMDGSISNTIEPPKTTSKIKTISNPELTLAHIALICYYQNIIINTSNAESILKEFNNPSTPKKIIEKYNHFMQKNNRVCCDETKADKAKHKRHLEVVQYLKNNNLEHESAVSDLEILQRNMNTSKY
jgi:hypothetical protein